MPGVAVSGGAIGVKLSPYCTACPRASRRLSQTHAHRAVGKRRGRTASSTSSTRPSSSDSSSRQTGLAAVAASIGSPAGRTPNRHPRVRMAVRRRVRSAKPSWARKLRPANIFRRHLISRSRSTAWSGSGGSDPPDRRTEPAARRPGPALHGGRSLPSPVCVSVGVVSAEDRVGDVSIGSRATWWGTCQSTSRWACRRTGPVTCRAGDVRRPSCRSSRRGSGPPARRLPPGRCPAPDLAEARHPLHRQGPAVARHASGLRHPWSDGTTHVVFDPVELLERLAVLIPRPRINLILYHGVLGPRAAWRSLVVNFGTRDGPGETTTTDAPPADRPAGPAEASVAEPDAPAPPSDECRGRPPRPPAARWADLMRRTFGIDTLACPRCGGRLRWIALIDEASVIERILRHLRLPTEVPTPRPARAPPLVAPCVFEEGTGTSGFVPCH
jgi:hypothetical protein